MSRCDCSSGWLGYPIVAKWLKEDGISLPNGRKNWTGAACQFGKLQQEIISKNLRNSIFVDITANDKVAAVYDQLLTKSISVVACNKVAASSAFGNYKKLKDLAREFNCQFLFETNVGAGLPVIATLNDSRAEW